MKQDQLFGLLRQMTPPVNDAGVWDAIQERVGTGRTRGARLSTRRLLRPLAFAAIALVVLVALGLGVRALVEHLGSDQSVVVITDNPMSPGGTASPMPAADGVYHLSYGQTVGIDGLEITITVMPTLAPVTGSDPGGMLSFHSQVDEWRLRSQYIITNTSSETRDVDLGAFELIDEDGNRNNPMAQVLELEPGGTLTGRLDFYLQQDVPAQAVVYTQDNGRKDLAVWGPEAITVGPGYPVLQTLPELRAEDVRYVDVVTSDPNGGEPSTQSYSPEAADLDAFIGYYEQTALVRSEGYPEYASPVQIIFHLMDGGVLTIGMGRPDDEQVVITDTRGSIGSNPPSAVGANRALVYAFLMGETDGETATTSGSASTTDQPTLSTTTSTTPVQGPKLKWGETAVLEGRTIRVEGPIEDPAGTGSRPGSKVVYCVVTVTNTGSKNLTFVASEFFLEGNSSGSTGIGSPEGTVGGHPVLDGMTLERGASVTVAVRFSLKEGDEPVKVRLVTASSTNLALASWQ